MESDALIPKASAPSIVLEPARMRDVEPIMELVNSLAAEGVMLPRSPASIVEKLRDFVVARVDGAFAGCGALSIVWTDIAEIRSIAVEPKFQSYGIGKRMAVRLIEDAGELGIARIVAFTYVVGFFEKLGFRTVEHDSLPHKVFNDCLNCPKFHKCDEVAVELVLKESPVAPLKSHVALPRPGRPFTV